MLADSTVMTFVATRDFARARAFYGDVLGLPLRHEDGFALVFALAGGILLRVARVAELTPAPYTVLGWQVDDVGASAAALAGRGVACERFPGLAQDARGVWTAPGGDQVAWFKDPDGNVLSISSRPR